MKLSIAERWMLSNQCRIMAKLFPDEAQGLDEKAEALISGYELHYRPDNITTNPDEIMTEEECREVLEILTMFQVLGISFKALADKSGVDADQITFDGFDGNHETKQMGYARYYCGLEGGRFKGVVRVEALNSHSQRLPRYKAMLREFDRIRAAKGSGGMKALELTKSEILAVASAR